MGNTTPRIGHFSTEVITGCDARHPTRANKRYTKKDSGRTAIDMCTRKPASCDTGLAEAHMFDGGHSARSDQSLRLLCRGNVTGSASGPQHFETRVSISASAGGQRRIGSATCAQQSRVVRLQRLHGPHTATGVRPTLHVDKNAVVHVVPHHQTTLGVAAPGNEPTIRRERPNRPPLRPGKPHMRDDDNPLR